MAILGDTGDFFRLNQSGRDYLDAALSGSGCPYMEQLAS